MASIPGGDPWRIPQEERAKHDAQFFSLTPSSGMITGDQARGFFLQSGLPPVVLGHIWALADMNADGKMDKKEFSIAMHLIHKKLLGFELPKVLPPSLKSEVVPGFGAMPGALGMAPPGAVGRMPGGFPSPGGFGVAPLGGALMHGLVNGGPALGGFGGGAPVAGFAPAPMSSPPPAALAHGEWGVPHGTKLKYTQKFNMLDRTKKGHLTGLEAREVLTQSNLTHSLLAQIWNLSDVDNDGNLTTEEFVLAMFLVDLAKTGQPLPAKLPPELVPPSYRRGRSGSAVSVGVAPVQMTSPPGQVLPGTQPVPAPPGSPSHQSSTSAVFHGMPQTDAFGDLVGGFGMGIAAVAMNIETELPPMAEPILPVTFEDKRQENFMKGQAELERRRELLRAEQKKMEEERLAHERAEAERRERIRQEQERKKQQELDKHLQKQREVEHEREEQRRKALEQREAARRELERQRQLEWERQRREQLMGEKLREQNMVDQMKSDVAKMKMDLETLENRKVELNGKIVSSRNGVTEFTKSIDSMRTTRDVKLANIEKFQNEIVEWTEKLKDVQQERQENDKNLEMQNSSISDTYRTVMHSYNSKQQMIEKMRRQLEQLEQDTATKLEEIDKCNSAFNEVNTQVTDLTNAHEELVSTLSMKQEDWTRMKRKQDGLPSPERDEEKLQNTGNGWGINAGLSAGGQPPAKKDVWGASEPFGATTATTNGNDVWGSSGFSTSDKFSSTSAAWWKDEKGGSDSTKRDEKTADWLSSLKTNTSTSSLSSLDWGTTTSTASMSKNSSVEWSNPAMLSNLYKETSELTGASNTASIDWTQDGSTTASPGWDVSTAAAESAGGSKATVFETVTSTSSILSTTSATKPAQASLDLFPSDAGGSPAWPEALAVVPPDAVDRSTSSEKELSGLWADVDSQVGSNQAAATVATDSDNIDQAVPPADIDNDLPEDPFGLGVSASYHAVSDQTDSWAGILGGNLDAFGSTTTSSQAEYSNSAWANSLFTKPQEAPKPGCTLYKALYQFEARNPDELSLNPDDIVSVDEKEQAGAEAGWMAGDCNDQHGWFPQAYVEMITMAAPAAVQTPPSATSPPSTDPVAENKEDVKVHVENAASNRVQEVMPEQTPVTLALSAESSFTAVTASAPSPTPGQGQKAEEGLQAQALYPWRAKKSNHLTFNKGDIINVHEQQDMWWSGSLGDKVGWFPKSYVKVLGGTAGVISEVSVEPKITIQTTAPTSSGDPSPAPDAGSEYYVALYAYSSSEPGDLTFNQGDVILVLRKDSDWWTGALNEKTGIFPANYVKMMDTQDEETHTESPLERPDADVFDSFDKAQDAQPNPTEPGLSGKFGQWDAFGKIDDMNAANPTASGDPFSPSGPTTDPFRSTGGDPFAPMEGGVVSISRADAFAPPQTDPFGQLEVLESLDQVSQMQSETHQKPGIKLTKKPEIASVIAPYQATGPEQLSLVPGQLIHVRKKSNSGWWEGELQARGQKRKIGWFPANYVKLLGPSSARSTPDPAWSSPLKSASPNLSDTGSRTETPQPYPQPTTTAPALEQVMALFNYTSQNEDELTFLKGSVLNVIDKEDKDWWKGELNGTTGVFPSNYVVPLSEAVTDGQDTPNSSSWAWGSHLALSPTESKRQSHIQELIDTEESYAKDMKVMIEAFSKPMLSEGVFTQEESLKIFVNWKELIMCNTKLLKALRVRRKMTGEGQVIHMVGDILCENLPHMTVYIRFCSCQLNAAIFIQYKSENDNHFKEVHKKCVQHPGTKGMPISSFLLKPMQRITKYPLMIEKILQYTPPEHPDNQNLQDALAKAQEICQQVNEGVREKENSDRLEWIQNHVNCDGLPEKITFNSVTNSLGPRKFLYSGSLYKAKSGKELVGFLFNDFLLLVQPQRPLGSVTSVFSLDIRTNMQFKMYRTPVFLNEVMIKRPTEAEGVDSTLFHLSHIDRMYSLKAVNSTERDTWIKKIDAASKFYIETERKKRERAHSFRSEVQSSTVGRLLVVILEGVDLGAGTARSYTKGCGRLLVIVLEGYNLIPSDSNVRRAVAVGRLLVVIMEGCKLSSSEDGKSDPYCEVSMGVQEHRTKVINNSLNPKWNASMQFTIKDLHEDVLCITVYDRDLFTPNDFLGRTEVRIKDIVKETREKKGPITKRLVLHEVDSGEVVVKLDLQIYDST